MSTDLASNASTDTESPVPLLDVSRSNSALRDEILSAVASVIDSGQFVLGPECVALEKAISQVCRTKHAIGCASGSDALLLALMALEIGPGDEVIVPSFTFFATASAVWRLGARPVFVDIDPATFNIDPQCVEAVITPVTKAMIPVHLFGLCAQMTRLREIASRHGIPVIEDVAQAIGAKYHGQMAGNLGQIGCFSFYPTKNLGGFGDGGMLTTSDDALGERLRLLRGHGMHPRYFHQMVGINSRLDSIQAAVLNVKLAQLDAWTAARQLNARRYTALLQAAGLEQHIVLPTCPDHCEHVWNQYTIRVLDGRRDVLREYLSDRSVGTEVYYPIPLHRQHCFQSLGDTAGSLPETERAAGEVLSLPIFPELDEAEQQTVVRHIGRFFDEASLVATNDKVPAPKFLEPNAQMAPKEQ